MISLECFKKQIIWWITSNGERFGRTTLFMPRVGSMKTFFLQCTVSNICFTISEKEPTSDLFILVHADFPSYTIIGGIRAEEFLQDWNIKDMGYGNKYIIESSALKPLPQLFA